MSMVLGGMEACVALVMLGSALSEGRELLVDPGFERGFTLTAAGHPAPKVEIGALRWPGSSATEPPAWRLAQWATRYLFEPGIGASIGDNRWAAENPAKRVTVERRAEGLTGLYLETRGSVEYDGRLRTVGEAWPHLLIEQTFGDPIRLETLARLRFSIEMRVVHCRAAAWAEDKLDRGLHTAQVSAFWTVHNLAPGNPDYRDMIWFGIPLFDARFDVPPPHYAIDAGKADASGKFICLLDGKRFWTGRTGDGQWRALDADLLSLLRDGLAIVQEHGHLKNTRLEDLAITSFNLGWEIPGPYDAAIEVRGLSMKAEAQMGCARGRRQ